MSMQYNIGTDNMLMMLLMMPDISHNIIRVNCTPNQKGTQKSHWNISRTNSV